MRAYLVCPNQERMPANEPAFVWHAQIIAMMITNWLSCILNGYSAAIVVHRKFWRFAVNWIPIKWRIMTTTRIIRISLGCIARAIGRIRIQMNLKRLWFSVLCAKTGIIQSKSKQVRIPLYPPCIGELLFAVPSFNPGSLFLCASYWFRSFYRCVRPTFRPSLIFGIFCASCTVFIFHSARLSTICCDFAFFIRRFLSMDLFTVSLTLQNSIFASNSTIFCVFLVT